MKLTERGIGFLVGGGLGVGAGIATGSVAAASLGVLLLLGLAFASTVARAPQLEARREVSSSVTREGVAVAVRLDLRAATGVAGQLDVEDGVPLGLTVSSGTHRATLDGRSLQAGVTLDYEVVGEVPVRAAFREVRLQAQDPLGLVTHEHTVAASGEVLVYPRVDDLREPLSQSRLARALSGDHLVGQGGLGSSFYALRDYRDGDSIRDVNWKASARSKGLVVNQRERETHARVHYLVDARAVAAVGTRRTNAWVLATRAIATLASLNFRRRDRSRLVPYGDGTHPRVDPVASDATQSALLDALVDRKPTGTSGLAACVDDLVKELGTKSPVVVVSNLLDDPTVAQGVQVLRALESHVVVVAPRGPELLRLAGESEAGVAEAREARARTVETCRALGALVIDWDPALPFPLAVLQEVAA